jgi:hypothetical protein
MKISFNNPPSPDLRNPFRSVETYMRIEVVTDCDGEPCGLTTPDGDVMPPIQPAHGHVVVTGGGPKAGPWRYWANFE